MGTFRSLERGCESSLRSEASNPQQLEVLIAVVKFMGANLALEKGLLVHSERFVDS